MKGLEKSLTKKIEQIRKTRHFDDDEYLIIIKTNKPTVIMKNREVYKMNVTDPITEGCTIYKEDMDYDYDMIEHKGYSYILSYRRT